MKINYIKEGSRIDTQVGELVVQGMNVGGHIYCDEYEVGEDEELHLVGSSLLTSNEIAERYWEYCGKREKFIYQEEEEE